MLIVVYIFAFLLTISLLVVFHEFGHFWVARKLGVRVLRFSVGFGKPLYRRLGRDGVEYVIAAIPLGGYVQMLDENELSISLSEEDAKTAFNRKSLAARTAIVAAGPIFNFILAFALYIIMFMIGTSVMRPVVGTIEPGSIADQAGLLPGDEITAVNDQTVKGWQQALLAILNHGIDSKSLSMAVKSKDGEPRVLNLSLLNENLLEDEKVLQRLGIDPRAYNPPAVIDEVLPHGAAARAGVRAGDRVVSLGGEPVDDWRSLTKKIAARAGALTTVGVHRDGSFLSLPIEIDSETDRQGMPSGRIGIRVHVDEDMMAKQRVFIRYGFFDSVYLGALRTWEMTHLTMLFIAKLITGQASLKHIGGPILIAEYTGASLLIGLGSFLGAVALLSVSIGLLNLLPIPVLDGGHLLFHLIEFVKGSPPSRLFQAVANRVGLFMLGGLMFLALFNDLSRLWNL